MLHLSGDWQVHEMRVEKDDWLADRPLADLNLVDEGIVVLGITRTDNTNSASHMN